MSKVPLDQQRHRRRDIAAAFVAASTLIVTVPARAEPEWEIAFYDDVRIEVIAEGRGPLIVMLPSRGRGAEDFEGVAGELVKAGFRVLRPQPRGAALRPVYSYLVARKSAARLMSPAKQASVFS
jgi:hypothetical protein